MTGDYEIHSGGTTIVEPFVARFAREFGGTTGIDLRVASNPEIAECLSTGEVDVGVMEWWNKRKGFSATRWHRERLMVIVNPQHLWAKKKTVRFISTRPGSRANPSTSACRPC